MSAKPFFWRQRSIKVLAFIPCKSVLKRSIIHRQVERDMSGITAA
jgi:hypothetical protein